VGQKTETGLSLNISERARKLGAIGISAAALFGASAQASRADKLVELPRAGIIEDTTLNIDYERSLQRVKEIKALGFKDLKVLIPWTYPTQHEVLNDQVRVANAAMAATSEGMSFTLNVYPALIDGQTSNAPIEPNQQSKFATTMGAWVQTLHERVPEMTKWSLEVGVEPNSSTFLKPQYGKDGEWIAPRIYTRMLARSYRVIKADAAKVGSEVTVIGGGLAANHDACEFIRKMGEAKRELGIRGQMMDQFSIHPYGKDSTESPLTKHPDCEILGIADYDQLTGVLQESFGRVPPIILSEYGIETSGAVKVASEAQQAEYHRQALELADSQEKVVGLYWFHAVDDPEAKKWQSGYYLADDGDPATPLVPKTSAPIIQSVLAGRQPAPGE
jgi:hypothetical protein